jgi:hypothetical protein
VLAASSAFFPSLKMEAIVNFLPTTSHNIIEHTTLGNANIVAVILLHVLNQYYYIRPHLLTSNPLDSHQTRKPFHIDSGLYSSSHLISNGDLSTGLNLLEREADHAILPNSDVNSEYVI